MCDSYGPSFPRIWKGVVEDRNDPLKMGRCRVRIFHLHSEKQTDIPTSDLPWATPMQPINSAGVSGIGQAPVGPVEGTIVGVIFNDEENMQDPIMIGSFGGKPAGPIFQTLSNLKTTPRQRKAVFNDGKDEEGNKVEPLEDMSKLEGRDVDLLIIHCTATKPSMDIGAEEVNDWHIQRGWNGIGYHAVIRRNGVVEGGRPLGTVGAHAQGYNSRSVGVSLVGGVDENNNPQNNFTVAQMSSLRTYVAEFLSKCPNAKVIGHNQVSSKACPSFDVQSWLAPNFPDAMSGDDFASSYPSHGDSSKTPLSASSDKKTDTGPTEGYKADVQNGVAETNPNFPQNNYGFVDTNGVYPKESYTQNQEPDVNRLARNDSTEGTIVQKKLDSRETTIPSVDGASYAEPATPYAAKYPYNHVYESESGNIQEVDDTPNAERLHRYHKSGTFEEIHPDGKRVTKIVGDDYLIINKDGNLYVKGNVRITVDGNANVLVGGDTNMEVKGNTNLKTQGLNVLAESDIKLVSRKDIILLGKNVHMNP